MKRVEVVLDYSLRSCVFLRLCRYFAVIFRKGSRGNSESETG